MVEQNEKDPAAAQARAAVLALLSGVTEVKLKHEKLEAEVYPLWLHILPLTILYDGSTILYYTVLWLHSLHACNRLDGC